MKRILLLGGSALAMTALIGCSSVINTIVPGASAWTPAQDAYFEARLATEAVNVANQVAATPGLSDKAKAQIATAQTAIYTAVTANVPTLLNGASTGAQIAAAGVASIMPAINAIGTIGSASGSGTAKPTALAMAAGLGAVEQLPQFVGDVTSLNSGWIPAQLDIDNALAALKTAANG